MKGAALTAAVWALAVGTAFAGGTAPVRAGYNIDFNLTSGTGAGLPANTFGAAAGQAGVWNSLGTAGITRCGAGGDRIFRCARSGPRPNRGSGRGAGHAGRPPRAYRLGTDEHVPGR